MERLITQQALEGLIAQQCLEGFIAEQGHERFVAQQALEGLIAQQALERLIAHQSFEGLVVGDLPELFALQKFLYSHRSFSRGHGNIGVSDFRIALNISLADCALDLFRTRRRRRFRYEPDSRTR